MSPALSVAEGRFNPLAITELGSLGVAGESTADGSGLGTAAGKSTTSAGATGSTGTAFPSSAAIESNGLSGGTGSLKVPDGRGGKGGFSIGAASTLSSSGKGGNRSGLETGESSPIGGKGGKDWALPILQVCTPITKQATLKVVLFLQNQYVFEGFIDGQF